MSHFNTATPDTIALFSQALTANSLSVYADEFAKAAGDYVNTMQACTLIIGDEASSLEEHETACSEGSVAEYHLRELFSTTLRALTLASAAA